MPSFIPHRFHFPGPRDRVAIVGKTGSGKSTFGLWLMAESADFDKKPWVFVDYKGEDIIIEAERRGLLKTITFQDKIPDLPGMYVIHPGPDTQHAMGAWMWAVWRRGKIGLFIDEAYMIPEYRGEAGSGGPYKALLTQGRSKEIPMYNLTQRPVDVNKHVFTEAQYLSMFRLKHINDVKRVMEYMPEDLLTPTLLQKVNKKYWSIWYDDVHDTIRAVSPCPGAEYILDTFAHRVNLMRKVEQV